MQEPAFLAYNKYNGEWIQVRREWAIIMVVVVVVGAAGGGEGTGRSSLCSRSKFQESLLLYSEILFPFSIASGRDYVFFRLIESL